jgi:hypothetical protein
MAGWTTLKGVTVLRKTAKSLQVRLPNGQEPYVPLTQMSQPYSGAMGNVIDISVKTWLVDKWKASSEPQPTFEFDPGDFELSARSPKDNSLVEADFIFDYSKKQLLAACMAYRSVLHQLAKGCTVFKPEIGMEHRVGSGVVKEDGLLPDDFGTYPMVVTTWTNPLEVRNLGKQAAAVLIAENIGQAMLEKMSDIERLLAEKRADVAAELLRSLDEDED